MIDMPAVDFLRGGDGLNSSRNFDFFVFATLLLRATDDAVRRVSLADMRLSAWKLVNPYRFTTFGVSPCSFENVSEKLRGKVAAVLLERLGWLLGRGRVLKEPPKLSGGLCGRLE
jgi:hypothetical protein